MYTTLVSHFDKSTKLVKRIIFSLLFFFSFLFFYFHFYVFRGFYFSASFFVPLLLSFSYFFFPPPLSIVFYTQRWKKI